ncbi:MAG TPA: GAF domain-containing protein [Leptolyngbyaceae cyanobacterium M33_DOE_097]|uniref:GAF domain-containing protein n=1 Tax=Oscillatoriales cyanobacterium SpSt-418 TaxID=2282169 RepID=A0A7C3PFT1_9CYAN|nr:GAF domain-containing protein [Leptolyngbyaceae cyanobacterium M33_DOE_097]
MEETSSGQHTQANLENAYALLQAEVLQLRRQVRDLQTSAAIAHERERAAQERAAELAKANTALKRSTAHLAHADSLKTFLHQVLIEATQAISAVTGAVFVYDVAAHTLQNAACVLHGEVVDVATDPRMEIWRSPIPANITAAWQVLSQKPQIIWFDNDEPHPDHWPFAMSWHEQMGHRTIACVPLIIGSTVLGFLGFGFTERRALSDASVEQCWVLAQHTALAIQLARLAEASKQTAIMREREQATQARAAELVRANRVLQRSMDCLIRTAQLEEFAGLILLEIAQLVDGVNCALFLYDQPADVMRLYMVVDEGCIIHPTESAQIQGFEIFQQPIRVAKTMFAHDQKPLIFVIDQTPKTVCSGTILDWHREQGHQAALCFPLQLAHQPWGFLGLAFQTVPTLSDETLELMQTLVHQLTLALYLDQISEEKEKTAIAEERNRLAREIHDTLAQSFTSILVRLQIASLSLTSDELAETQAHIDYASELARTGLIEARRSVYALRPSPLEAGNLATAVAEYLQCATEQVHITSHFDQVGELPALPAYLEVELFRIAQEAITNACKHANAKTLHVQIAIASSQLQLSIQDDGCGFLLPEPYQSSGFGLINMEERANRIDAKLKITSQLRHGTLVFVMVDLATLPSAPKF